MTRRNRDSVILGAGLAVLIEGCLLLADNFWIGVILFYLGIAGIGYALKQWLN